MPVVKRGIIFAYFDKAICALVLVGILLAAVHTVRRTGTLARTAPPEEALEGLQAVRDKLARPAQEVAVRDFQDDILARFRSSAEPRTMRSDIFHRPAPQREGPTRVAPGSRFVVEFSSPLTEGSVRVSSGDALVRVIQHPVEGDYSRVALESTNSTGSAVVVGQGLSGRHEYRVVVDREGGKDAAPPAEVVVSGRQGGVELTIRPNPANRNKGVEVVGYEIWRRDWDDPLGSFRKVATATPGGTAPAAPTRRGPTGPTGPTGGFGRPSMPGIAPWGGQQQRQQQQPRQPGGEVVTWRDDGAKPGSSYSYKVRTVGSNTYPRASEFAEPILVKAAPNVDFRFLQASLAEVAFEVAKRTGPQTAQRNQFWVGRGEQIGGIARTRSGEVINLLTDAVVVDFHSKIILEGAGVTDRLIYADSEGNLHMRLRRESESEELWGLP